MRQVGENRIKNYLPTIRSSTGSSIVVESVRQAAAALRQAQGPIVELAEGLQPLTSGLSNNRFLENEFLEVPEFNSWIYVGDRVSHSVA